MTKKDDPMAVHQNTSQIESVPLLEDAGIECGSKGSKPARIVYLDHTSKMGGGEIAIYNLTLALDRSRFTPIFVLACEGPLAARLRNAGIETHVLALDPTVKNTRKDSLGLGSLLRMKAIWSCVQYVGKLTRLIGCLDAQIVHTNSLKAHLYGGLAARIAGKPVIWHVRDNITNSYLPEVVARAIRWMAQHLPTHVVANSNSTLKNLGLKRAATMDVVYSGIQPPKDSEHSVIHDGLNLRDFDHIPRKEAVDRQDTHPTITMVGRIAEWKGQHVFLKAARRVLRTFPNAKFQIIGGALFGEDDYERTLHDLIVELGLESAVEFFGFRDDVAQLIAACDVLVHASIIGEPFGQVVIEGMISGKPVIATNGGALPEIVVHGETGLLVAMGDAAEMAMAIELLLTDPAKSHAMGVAGRIRVLEKFLITTSVVKIHEVYERILSLQYPVTRRKSTILRSEANDCLRDA